MKSNKCSKRALAALGGKCRSSGDCWPECGLEPLRGATSVDLKPFHSSNVLASQNRMWALEISRIMHGGEAKSLHEQQRRWLGKL